MHARQPSLVVNAKERGDKFYREGFYKAAAAEYSHAIDNASSGGGSGAPGSASSSMDDLALLRSNRCACYLQLNRLDDALSDARYCVREKPQWVKGYLRLGSCLQHLNRLREAVETYELALTRCSEPLEIRQALTDCRKRLNDSGATDSNGSSGNDHRHTENNHDSSASAASSAFISPETWRAWKEQAQRLLAQILTWWSLLAKETKMLYGALTVGLLYYLFFARRSWPGYDDDYEYRRPASYGYGTGGSYGGLSTVSLALIMAAAYYIPPHLESVLGPERARPFFGMNWSTFLWLVTMLTNRSGGLGGGGFFGGGGFRGRRRTGGYY